VERPELEAALEAIFNPELDEHGLASDTPPHPRLIKAHGLDASYWKQFEFGSTSRFSRLVQDPHDPLNEIIASLSAPFHLFWSALRLFGDSILAYHKLQQRRGPFRFYPPIIATAWAGLEAFVRLYSEMLVRVGRSLPEAVSKVLVEVEEYVERDGSVNGRFRPRPVLERYWLFLKYGYGYEFDRGSKIWQDGEAAYSKRNELVHYDVLSTPSLTSTDVFTFIESVLLLLMAPSVSLKRSIFSSQHEIYWALAELEGLIEEFEERPTHKGWPFSDYLFPCSFENIDDDRYPAALAKPSNT